MFSDNFRFLKIIIPFVLITIIVVYGVGKLPLVYPGYNEALETPNAFIGKEIFFGGRILEVKNKSFIVKTEKKDVLVNGRLNSDAKGSLISGKAIYQKDNSLKMSDYHISNLRQYKILVSAVPAFLVLYFFFKKYRFDFKKFLFKRKSGD